ncbi:unnamed protein product [Sympodiomycopsis kandeliae]
MAKFLQVLHAAALLGLTAFNLASGSTLPYGSSTGYFDVNALARDFQGNSTAAAHDHSDGWKKHLNFATDYYPSQWDEATYWEDDVAGQKNASLTYVRIGEFDWGLFEPQDGEYDWTILDKTFDLMHKNGLKVILGTPEETPPLWAVQNYDILPKGPDLATRRFGSRHHFSFSAPDMRKLSKRIVTKLAQRYGKHPALGGWQLSNEFGCHDTVRTFDDHAKTAFQEWLKVKYNNNITSLNEQQGRVFWSSQFYKFSDIDVPTQEVTESNPAHRLDWFTFSSDQVISFAKQAAESIRAHSNAPITTNFMDGFLQFDHHKLAKEGILDFSTHDVYPLGNLESSGWQSDENKVKYVRTGHVDFQSFHHSLNRHLGDGKFGVMELQPGPVNWAQTNPSPLKGMVRLWLHEIFAHGGSLGNIFRWREVPFAEEQMHAGMYRRDNVKDLAYIEQQETVSDVKKMKDAGLLVETDGDAMQWADDSALKQGQVALILDYNAAFLLEANPQGGVWDTNTFTDFTFIYQQLVTEWYIALRRLGIDVDIVGPYTKLEGYKMVVAPSLPKIGSDLEKHLSHYSGSLIVGPRTASKEPTLSIARGLPPAKGVLRERLPMIVTRVESLRSDVGDQVTLGGNSEAWNVTGWSEWIECERNGEKANGDASAEFTFKGYRDGEPASCSHTTQDGRKTRYVGWYALSSSLTSYFANAASEAGVKTATGVDVSADSDLGDYIRWVRHGKALYAFNYSNQARDVTGLPDGAELVVGGVDGDSAKIGSAGVNVYKV